MAIARKAVDPQRRRSARGSIVLVLLVAGVLVAAATGFVVLGRGNAEPYILGFLALLATVGVFRSLLSPRASCGCRRLKPPTR